MVQFQDNEWTEGYHPDVSYGQHDWQRQFEDGVLVERAEVGQREEADGGHQVDLGTVLVIEELQTLVLHACEVFVNLCF